MYTTLFDPTTINYHPAEKKILFCHYALVTSLINSAIIFAMAARLIDGLL